MCVLNINQEDIFISWNSFHENEEQFSVSSERQEKQQQKNGFEGENENLYPG